MEAILPVTRTTPRPKATSETPGIVTKDVTHHSHSVAGVALHQQSSHTLQESGQSAPGKSSTITGDDPVITLDDWLPSLERATTWNGWSMSEELMKLPGYLRGRALQEWRLLGRTLQQDYETAISALGSRLDPGRKTMAAQDFRHSAQKSGE